MKTRAVFTICCRNYLAYGRVLLDSAARFCPDADRFLVLCEDSAKIPDDLLPDAKLLCVPDLNIPDVEKYAFAFSILEFNTNIKPAAFLRLMEQGYDEVLYLDPDIKIFSRLDPVWPSLLGASIVLTPHITRIISDGKRPDEVDHMKSGLYNLGFAAVRNNETGVKFLKWWSHNCLTAGFKDSSEGVFVDQKFCDLVPLLFDEVYIQRHVGSNVAYWNLQERKLALSEERWIVNESTELMFYHFSGIDPMNRCQLSKYCNRYTLESLPELVPLFEQYRAELLASGHLAARGLPYSYGCTTAGRPISMLERRLSVSWRGGPVSGSFFDDRGAFQRSLWFLRHSSKRSRGEDSFTRRTVDPNHLAIRSARIFCRLLCFLIGTRLYEIICKAGEYFLNLRRNARLMAGDSPF